MGEMRPLPVQPPGDAWICSAVLLERWLAQRGRLDSLMEAGDFAAVRRGKAQGAGRPAGSAGGGAAMAGGQERARCQHLLFGAVRNLGRLEALFGGMIRQRPRGRLRAALLVAGFELLEAGAEPVQPVQPGSSIMPGKVNPVMAECLNMIAFQVVGNDLATSLAVQAGQMELNVMTPIIAYNMLFSIQILANYIPVFTAKCVKGIMVDEKRCEQYLEKNPSLATLLAPKIGYLEAAKIAKQAQTENRTVKEVVLKKGLLKPDEIEKIFSRKNLLNEQ